MKGDSKYYYFKSADNQLHLQVSNFIVKYNKSNTDSLSIYLSAMLCLCFRIREVIKWNNLGVCLNTEPMRRNSHTRIIYLFCG